MITAKNDSNMVTRNSSQFKVISTKSAGDGKEVQPKVAKPSTLEEQKERPKRNAGRPARFAPCGLSHLRLNHSEPHESSNNTTVYI